MDDLTIIYLTANQHPEHFTAYQRRTLGFAVDDFPLINVTREVLNFGGIDIIDNEPKSHLNMYKQLVRAAKLATTPYIAVAEDDTLYPAEHFAEFRPPLDAVAYDRNRWSLFTWTKMFNMKDRISNCTLIAGREYYIEAWEERFAKFPGDTMPPHRVSEIGRHNQESWMGVSKRNQLNFWCTEPTVQFNHPNGTDSVGQKKRMGAVRAIEIPYWGRAEDLIKEYR